MYLRNTLYNTFPFVLHCPSCDEEHNDIWERAKNIILKSKYKLKKEYNDIEIITWNNSEEVSILEKSLSILGITAVVLGKSIKKWNNRLKINLTCDYLSSTKKPYILGIDAFDAILIDVPKRIDRDLIFNSTIGSFPERQEFDEYEESICNSDIFCHLNAGAWFGKREFCIRFFESALNYEDEYTKDYPMSEQAIIRSILPKHDYVSIDGRCEYFQTLNLKRFYKDQNQYVQLDSFKLF